MGNLGSAFSATALFLLGLKMVGRVKTVKGNLRYLILNCFSWIISKISLIICRRFLWAISLHLFVQIFAGTLWIAPLILIFCKILILPLLARELASVLLTPSNSYNSTEVREFSDFAFLYGTFPTAPTVFVYASQYNVMPEIIARYNLHYRRFISYIPDNFKWKLIK